MHERQEGTAMSNQIIAFLVTVGLFILMCVWVPLLDSIAIGIRKWTVARRTDNAQLQRRKFPASYQHDSARALEKGVKK
jgi:hypothetical protein